MAGNRMRVRGWRAAEGQRWNSNSGTKPHPTNEQPGRSLRAKSLSKSHIYRCIWKGCCLSDFSTHWLSSEYDLACGDKSHCFGDSWWSQRISDWCIMYYCVFYFEVLSSCVMFCFSFLSLVCFPVPFTSHLCSNQTLVFSSARLPLCVCQNPAMCSWLLVLNFLFYSLFTLCIFGLYIVLWTLANSFIW